MKCAALDFLKIIVLGRGVSLTLPASPPCNEWGIQAANSVSRAYFWKWTTEFLPSSSCLMFTVDLSVLKETWVLLSSLRGKLYTDHSNTAERPAKAILKKSRAGGLNFPMLVLTKLQRSTGCGPGRRTDGQLTGIELNPYIDEQLLFTKVLR